ncbi:MAG: hypothetical protein QXH07_04720 [Thermoplasmata archaeon]
MNWDLPITLDLNYSYYQRKDIVDEIKKLSILYKNNCESKVIILTGENEKGERGIKVILYIHPFQNSREALFLTLIISYREFGSIGDGAKWTQKQFNSLMTVLRKKGWDIMLQLKRFRAKHKECALRCFNTK